MSGNMDFPPYVAPPVTGSDSTQPPLLDGAPGLPLSPPNTPDDSGVPGSLHSADSYTDPNAPGSRRSLTSADDPGRGAQPEEPAAGRGGASFSLGLGKHRLEQPEGKQPKREKSSLTPKETTQVAAAAAQTAKPIIATLPKAINDLAHLSADKGSILMGNDQLQEAQAQKMLKTLQGTPELKAAVNSALVEAETTRLLGGGTNDVGNAFASKLMESIQAIRPISTERDALFGITRNTDGTVSDIHWPTAEQAILHIEAIVQLSADVVESKNAPIAETLMAGFFGIFKSKLGPDGVKRWGGYDWGTACQAFTGKGTPGEGKGFLGALTGHRLARLDALRKKPAPDRELGTNVQVRPRSDTDLPASVEVRAAEVHREATRPHDAELTVEPTPSHR